MHRSLSEDSFEDLAGEVDGNLCIIQDAPVSPLLDDGMSCSSDGNDQNDNIRHSEREAVPERLVTSTSTNDNVLAQIEAVFEQFADALLDDRKHMTLALKRRTSRRSVSNENVHTQSDFQPTLTSVNIRFPGKSAEEAWRFTVLVRLLELIYEAIRKNTVLSKRDIFYRDPALFGRQSHVDRYIDDIALTFDVPRSALNISAVSKGLIAGAATFCRRDGSTFSAAAEREGTPVPKLADVLSVDLTAVHWILVIEKEASFRSVASSAFWSTVSCSGLIITAKGYPDIATRALLRFLTEPSVHNGFASPPAYGFMDFDPDGLSILSTYKYGSARLSHQTVQLHVPKLQRLGLRCEHLSLVEGNCNTLKLSQRDRKRAVGMLSHDPIGQEEDIRQDLQRMLMLNVKAELQILNETAGGISSFLTGNLMRTSTGSSEQYIDCFMPVSV